VLSELRDRLRARDVWVAGSRRYRSFEERLISHETQRELLQSGILPIAVDPDFERFIAGRPALLDERLAAIDVKAKGGLLPDVTLERGVLKITPIEKSTPPGPRCLPHASMRCFRASTSPTSCRRWRAERCFTHLRSGETVADPRVLMAGLLADGLNLGLTRMAEACTIVGIFPNEAAIVRLIGAVLLEHNDEWQLQHRHMQVEAMAELVAPANAADPRQIPCAG
jgi:Transposase, Mutator family/Tn3 transposase DDE domain